MENQAHIDVWSDAVSALVFNRKYPVSGAQPYELLVQVTEKVSGETAVIPD